MDKLMFKTMKKQQKIMQKDGELIAKSLSEISKIKSDDLRIRFRNFLTDEFLLQAEKLRAIREWIKEEEPSQRTEGDSRGKKQ